MRHSFSRTHRRLVCLAALTTATHGAAAPELRKSVDQKGDFVLFGNTLGWDCNQSASLVLTGTVDCTGTASTADSAIDVYWRSQQPGDEQALASSAVAMADARSTAMLVLPPEATITYARLYWAAFQPSGGAVDNQVTIDRPDNINVLNVTADRTWTAYVTGTTGKFWYQGAADITDWMNALGPGAFRVGGVSSVADLPTYNDTNVMAGWSVVVFYTLATDPSRNLTLFEGLDSVNNGSPQEATLSGFLVPAAGYDAKLGVVAYEGDADAQGDSLRFGPDVAGLQILSNTLNPQNNFFNSTHSYLGTGVKNDGDLPRLTGEAASMGGIDIDVVDVKSLVQANQTSAIIRATSSNEHIALATLVTSISTFKPDFSNSGKTVTDVNGGGLVPGDTLEYTITVTNSGTDTSENTVMTDLLPTQVTYVPGSLALGSPAALPLTDAVDGGDTGSYNDATRTVTVNLGTGASSTTGGSMLVGDTIVLKFRVTLNGGATGLIENQAKITAEGAQGAPATNYLTDGNGTADGTPPTVIGVDSDSDGIPDVTEATLGTNPNDADSDDDGVIDGDEPNPGLDPDGDGLINALDPDSDNDGLFDGTEMGRTCDNADTAPNANRCIPDADAGATTTNPLMADSDGGGKSDGSEDANLNGRLDAGETDPTSGHEGDDGGATDSDGDGLSDALEATLGSDPADKDSDNDGVLDGLEPNPHDDGDHDGLINVLDSDSDDDGLFDGTELGYDCSNPATDPKSQCVADADPATHTSAVIADTDHGGIRDGSEDFNRNGKVDAGETDPTVGHGADDTLTDTDGDGLSDGLEQALGSDPNDADTDDDGVPDGKEANPSADTDGDGLINVVDPDSDGDGLFDGTELGYDCSGTDTTPRSPATCTADADPTTLTSPVDPDTDRGGVKDGTEDTNHNGKVDPGERDPNVRGDDNWTCFADSDCDASVTSGRVCSAEHQCVDGCRGSGGNGCPSGQVCSSTTSTIGSCSTPGGIGGAPGTAGATGSPDIGGATSAGSTGTFIATAGTAGRVPSGGGTSTANVAGNAGTRMAGGAASVAGSATAGNAGSILSGIAGLATGGSSTTVGGTNAAAGATAGGESAASGGSTAVAAGGTGETGATAALGGAAEAAGGQAGGVDTGSSLEGSGCDCTMAGKTGRSNNWLLGVLVGLLWLKRKRSR